MSNAKAIADYKRARKLCFPNDPEPRLEKIGRGTVDRRTQYRVYIGTEYMGIWTAPKLEQLTATLNVFNQR